MDSTVTSRGPQPLAASIAAACQSDPSDSAATTKRTPAERRLDAAFDAFNARRELSGRKPAWTASLRAERWAAFALECRELLSASGVPVAERGWDIEAISPRLPAGYHKLASVLVRLMDAPAIVAVGGVRGTGKSTLAWGLVEKFCNVRRPAVYTTAAEVFHELSDAPWEEKQQVRDRLFKPDLLVIDEVQVRSEGRAWQDSELSTLIDRRYREHKATLLLSNLEPEALRQNLGESIWRRVIETGGLPYEAAWGRIKEVLGAASAEAKKAAGKA